MTNYFYDTEFLENGSTIELISIGIVSDTGREYYAVNADMDEERIRKSHWLVENVIPHLPLRGKVTRSFGSDPLWSLDTSSTLVKPKWVIRNEVREFLLGDPSTELGDAFTKDRRLWAYYGAYDHVALMQLWGPMIRKPKGLPMWTHDLMQLIEDIPDFVLPEQDSDEHHALADARWNRQVWEAAMAARGVL